MMSDAVAVLTPELLREITDFVGRVRAVFEAHRDKFGYLGVFPENACGQASEILAQCLADRFSVSPACVYGFGRPEKHDAPHVWITLDGVVIDVTHDQQQFQPTELPIDKWVFAAPTAWHDAFDEKDVRPMLDRGQWQDGHEALYLLAIDC